MRKLLFTICILGIAVKAMSQAAWIEPVPTLATEKITIYVDLDKLDMSLDHNKLLAADPGPMYFWTWKPFEFPTGSPKVNGLGEKPWKNSNDLLEMTPAPDKGPKVWKFEMVPTEFYEVTATQVYASGLAFLVKPKDGGGYGDPDVKSNDLTIPITPPKTDKGAVYQFPTVMLGEEITTIVYDNGAEKKATMQNLDPSAELFVYLKATAMDTATAVVSTYQPSSFFQVPNNPNLKMKFEGSGKWKFYMIPNEFFGIPGTQQLVDLEILVRKKDWLSDDDTSGDKPKPKFGCD
jgi:hypothetical protein